MSQKHKNQEAEIILIDGEDDVCQIYDHID